jgi:hypothetical protein
MPGEATARVIVREDRQGHYHYDLQRHDAAPAAGAAPDSAAPDATALSSDRAGSVGSKALSSPGGEDSADADGINMDVTKLPQQSVVGRLANDARPAALIRVERLPREAADSMEAAAAAGQLLSRKELSALLTARGYPIAVATLRTLGTRGGGPPYVIEGKRSVYGWADALAWAEGKMKAPKARGRD